MKEILLRASHLKKTFLTPSPLEVLSDISLDVERGTSVAIMGKSGEGKSTLLHILGTLESPTEGSLTICSHTVARHTASRLRNKHIGFVFQAFHLLEDSTALHNVLMPAKIARKQTHSRSEAHDSALKLLHSVGLLERAHVLARHLSGGEKQRVAIARALCNNPDLILADEPSGNLDRTNSLAVYDLLLDLVKRLSKTLVVVTHDDALASRCDKTLILRDGLLH